MADGRDGKLKSGGSGILPPTFQQRGVYLPYTTPVLSYARLRRGPGGALDILIPGLAGGTEVYVIPLKVIHEIINLSVHDRALNEEIPTIRSISPITVRETANRVAQTGLGGPSLARRAKQENLALRDAPAQIQLNMIKTAIQQLAKDNAQAQELDERSIATPDGMALARNALGGFAQTIGEMGETLYRRLETWSDIISPVGSPSGTISGYLMTLFVDTQTVATELSKWLLQEPPETAEMAQRTVTAAQAATGRAREHLKIMDDLATQIGSPLADFDNTEKKLKHCVDQISYSVDGWQRVVDMWHRAKAGDRFLQRDYLEAFAQHLPIMPQEAAAGNMELWETLRKSQTRWSRNSQHRLDRDLDQDTREKLGQFRKESV